MIDREFVLSKIVFKCSSNVDECLYIAELILHLHNYHVDVLFIVSPLKSLHFQKVKKEIAIFLSDGQGIKYYR